MNKFALGYKGVFKINHIRNIGVNSDYIDSYREVISNHKNLLHSPLREENVLDTFISSYNVNEQLNIITLEEFSPKKIDFLPNHFINVTSEISQIHHYKKIVKMILDYEYENNFNYDYIILTRPDILFHKNYKNMFINFDRFNITVEHLSKNCDDNFWLFPRIYLKNFEKSLDLLLNENKIVHEINHKLSYFNIPIHYMETLVESYMGHNLFEFVR